MADPQALLSEGIQLLRRGRTSKARTCLERLQKEDPGNALGLSYLGVTLALADKDYRQAEDCCFRAVMQSLNNAQLHANLAWVYHLQGKRKNAVASIDDALERDPKNGDALRIRGVLGTRQVPPLSFLSRTNPINRALGKLTHKISKGR